MWFSMHVSTTSVCHLPGMPALKCQQRIVVCALSPHRQREIETVKQLQEETSGQAEALGLELQKATKKLEDASKQVRDSLVPSTEETNKQMQKATYNASLLLGKEIACSEWSASLQKWNQQRK